ncbi:MAG: pyrroline-5-carboxylate reductase [Planctomycetes bacterium]|nr:pyrroline-5-carboxylate reductase [Planctomycetota bacterium]
MKIAMIGCGHLGRAVLQGILDAGIAKRGSVSVTTHHAATAQTVAKNFGVKAGTDNAAVVRGCDLLIVATKPTQVLPVLRECAATLPAKVLVVSLAAAISTASIEGVLAKGTPVVRAMPNTPALVGCGMTAVAAGQHAREKHVVLVERVFNAVGRTIRVDEKHFDAVTGLSASGPAFVFMVIESMVDGGVKAGLPRQIATLLAAQTVMGSGAMVLGTGQHPALLKAGVTTPAGCTIDGLIALEEGGLRVALIKAVATASLRAGQLCVPTGTSAPKA